MFYNYKSKENILIIFFLFICLIIFISISKFENEIINFFYYFISQFTEKNNIVYGFKKFKIIYFPCIIILIFIFKLNFKINTINYKKLFLFLITVILFSWLINIYIFNFRDLNSVTLKYYNATHFLFSYQEFGFIKRSLTGSFLSLFNANKNYNFILIFSLLIFFLNLITVFIFLRILNEKKLNFFNFLCITSSGFFLFFISDLGRFDQINYLITFITIIYILKKNNINFLFINILIIIAMLIHEAFILFQFPLIYFCILVNYFNNKNNTKILELISPILIALILLLMSFTLGFIEELSLNEIKEIATANTNFDWKAGVFDTFIKNQVDITGSIKNPFNNMYFIAKELTIYLIIFLPIFIYILIFWIINFKFFEHRSLYYFGMITTIIPVLVTYCATFIDHYRAYTFFIISNFIILNFISFNQKKQNRSLNFPITNILNLNFGLLYNFIIYIFFGPLEKTILLLKLLIYKSVF